MNKRQINESRNLEQMLNDLRIERYTQGYKDGYESACRWNGIGWADEEGPLPVDDDMDDEDEDDCSNEPEEPGTFDGGPFD